MPLAPDQIQRIAALELNTLMAGGVLGSQYEKVSIPKRGTPVYDINGEILFYRLPLKGRATSGYADIAANEALGEPLIGVTMDREWNEKELLAEAVKNGKVKKYDSARFVAYSYPKVAIQFLLEGKEVVMLELYTWAEVPQPSNKDKDRKPMEPSNFERWSLIDEMPKALLRRREKSFKEKLEIWGNKEFNKFDLTIISKEIFTPRIAVVSRLESRELHYSKDNSDHHVCYELRGQQTNVWCVGASAEMLLNFYRYEYNQVRLAQELGLGTLNNPNGLPYANVGLVVTVLENLTSNALDATMHTNPAFTVFRNEIRANRPLISFVPGHSRTVAGFTDHTITFFGSLVVIFRGLLVYDPWPPNVGVITRWENTASQTYQFAYSAVLKHV